MSKVLLLDLGHVVLHLDPGRVFEHWARHSASSASELRAGWQMCDAYKAHETGHITFADYTQILSTRHGVELPPQHWLDGWNAVFVRPYANVLHLAARIRNYQPVYAFSNTNPEHEAVFRARYADELRVFEHIYTSPVIGRRKPEVDAYRHVADAIGVSCSDITFVDDTAENIRGARDAGMTAHLARGESEVCEVLQRYLARLENTQ